MKRALISVSDKTGLLELARSLNESGWQIISTGGTARYLEEAGIPVLAVVDVTGFPECLDGRVKTLHPKIHGGILADRKKPQHLRQLADLDIEQIDMVVVNLYPFRQTLLKKDVSEAELIEQIDIGGPTLLRAAAKNMDSVTVLIDPSDYEQVMTELAENGRTSQPTRLWLARKVFEHTASYDAVIAGYLCSLTPERTSDLLTLPYERIMTLRYGENPHQQAGYFRALIPQGPALTDAEQLNGKMLSYNNIADTDAAISLLKEFSEPTVVAVKHANPCGVASASNILEAWQKAYEADPVSIFGGIAAFNRPVDLVLAQATKEVFLEVMIAPDYTSEALAELKKRRNLRVLRLPQVAQKLAEGSEKIKDTSGGLLLQQADLSLFEKADCRTVTRKSVPEEIYPDLVFAMKVCKHAKSNAIVLAKNSQTVGIGMGQPNRVTSVEIAVRQAGAKAQGSILASDAFFPFADSVKAAAAAGVAAIIQPGGSIRDQESIDACDEAGLAMVFTGKRHFAH